MDQSKFTDAQAEIAEIGRQIGEVFERSRPTLQAEAVKVGELIRNTMRGADAMLERMRLPK
jgi:hypothetical protein